MSRALVIGGTLVSALGASSYYGLGKTWGGPAAVIGVTALSAGIAGQALSETGPTRWAGLAVAASGLAVAASVTASAVGSRASGPVSGPVHTSLFVLFGATTAVFGATALLTRSLPASAGLALLLGGPLLAAGAWKERLGDVGFLLTIVGFLLLTGMTDMSSSPGETAAG